MRQINDTGLEMLKNFEGCKLTAYRDMGGILTVGWGHCGKDVYEGEVITQDHADQLLINDLQRFCVSVSSMVTSNINSNQFSALVDFAYNLGPGNLKSSTLLKKVNTDPSDSTIPDEFLKWNHDKGTILAGLTKRRQAEADLWNSAS